MNPSVVCTVAAILVCLLSSVSGACFEKNEPMSANLTSSAVSGILDGFTDFGLLLFKKSIAMRNTTQDYIFISPMSIWMTLTTMFLGARSGTQLELRQLLGFGGLEKNEVAEQLEDLKDKHFPHITKANDVDDAILLENSFYVQESEPMRSCIMRQLDMELDMMRINLTSDPDLKHVIQGINALVSFQTEGRIAELIPTEYVDASTRMLAINTASFYGHWRHPFDPRSTKSSDFRLGVNVTVEVDMMRATHAYRTANSSSLNCSAVEVPYRGDAIALVVLLPNGAVDDLVASLDGPSLNDLLQDLDNDTLVDLELPKFKIEQATELRDVLNAVGLEQLFDAGRANLTGFSEKQGLYLKGIRHLPFIEFNEKGTTEFPDVEARNTRRAAGAGQGSTFVVDRPFVFLLRHNVLKRNLFMGLAREPSY